MELKPEGWTSPVHRVLRQYSASRCSRPTELYMVCPWKREGLYLQLTCVSWTKRIYTQLYITLKCMELCVYIHIYIHIYIYISDKWWNVALLIIYLAATSNFPQSPSPWYFPPTKDFAWIYSSHLGSAIIRVSHIFLNPFFISSHYHL